MGDLDVFAKALEAVCSRWNVKHSENWGFSLTVEGDSLRVVQKLWQDLLSGNPEFPKNPGPFKCAAAFLVAAWAELRFVFTPLDGAPELTPKQSNYWKSRFLFKTIPLILQQWTLKKGGVEIPLKKIWDVPTIHYRLDFLNFIRLSELPLECPSKTEFEGRRVINMVRTSRLIMAFALIIECCYYQSGNELTCDMMGNATIRPDDLDEDHQPDLYFDYEN